MKGTISFIVCLAAIFLLGEVIGWEGLGLLAMSLLILHGFSIYYATYKATGDKSNLVYICAMFGIPAILLVTILIKKLFTL